MGESKAKRIFRQQYDFGNSDKYRIFLKKNILSLNPRYYSVSEHCEVTTVDGLMHAVKIITELTDPSFEPIVECIINRQFIYLWRDQCWAVAVDKHGDKIIMEENNKDYGINATPEQCNKTLIIHQIGTDPI